MKVLESKKFHKSCKLIYKRRYAKQVVGYTNPDWASDLNDRKLTNGYIQTLCI